MNQSRFVLAGIALLAAVQLRHAAAVHLNADEALIYLLANQNTISDALAMTRANAHPPLLTLLLMGWSRISTSEVFLRLIPILANAALLWFTYRWASLAVGRTAGVLLTATLAFLPPVFALASELRHYSLLLAGIAASWWTMEEAFHRKSPRWIAISAGCLSLALLSHFSALFAIAGAGLYALYQLRHRGWPRNLLLPWATGQAGLLVVLALLASQLLSLRGSAMAREVRSTWLAGLQCNAGDLGCTVSKLPPLLEFFFATWWLGAIAGLSALAGLTLLARDAQRRGVALLLGTTILTTLAAVTAGEYPLGASRHSVVIAYALAATSIAVPAQWLEKRPKLLLPAVAGVAALLLLLPSNDGQGMPEREQRREFMTDAIAYLRNSVPRGGLVFTDYQAAMLLCYYWNPRQVCSDRANGPLLEFDLGDLRIASARTWSLDPTPFAQELQNLKRQFNLSRGAEVWVFDAGWGSPVNRPLAVQFGGTEWPGLQEFGEHIGAFRIPN
ncbi:MAG: glycosyltransferase family 39 protein [Bryobacterales bacterium]|nr:glycosyltransferase family 39 protein [Bryobacterales bacterium]